MIPRMKWRIAMFLCLLGLSSACLAAASSFSARGLNTGWQFHSLRIAKGGLEVGWREATVPGVVQQDLLRYGLMADPSYGVSEPSYQWIGLSNWEYRTTFTLAPTEVARQHLELVFYGLDTFATVYLNNDRILDADNMFRQWRVSIKDKVRPGANELRIVFQSPVETMLAKIKAMPYMLPTVQQVTEVSEDGVPTDAYTRKAPYQYGWDFNPRMITQGIWQPVELQAWDGLRLRDVFIHERHVSEELADFDTELTIDADANTQASVLIDLAPLQDAGGAVKRSEEHVELHPGENHISLPGSLAHPALWWPNGLGAQALYRIHVTVRIPNDTAEREQITGFRSVKLLRQKDAWGKSFGFEINGVPVFAKGASVVPIDIFPTRITRDRLNEMLTAAKSANMNMVRVWGGGIYEPDAFYELCDRLGLMVWQDFMFGGAEVPSDPDFRKNVEQEARYQITRLRNHPSLVLWCGNNETELKFYQPHLLRDYTEKQQAEMHEAYLLLFSNVISLAVAELDDPVPYWPSTPSAGYDMRPNVSADGDMHYWPVWYQNLPAEMYTEQNPRFMAEFGFESFPEMSTLKRFAPPDQLRSDSPVMIEHQKSNGARGNKTIVDAVLRDYGQPKDFPSLVYLSQVEQADAMKIGTEDFRSERPRCMGALYWELQDGWPAVYSSSIDYFGKWKALQWYARRFFAPTLLVPVLRAGEVVIYAVNDTLRLIHGSVDVRLMDFEGNVLHESSRPVDALSATSTQVLSEDETAVVGGHDPLKVYLLVEWKDGDRLLSSNELFFAPVKKLALPQSHILSTLSSDRRQLTLKSDTLARDVRVSILGAPVTLSDNYFDLQPGAVTVIQLSMPLPPDARIEVSSLEDALGRPSSP